jgi:hypothetical protein
MKSKDPMRRQLRALAQIEPDAESTRRALVRVRAAIARPSRSDFSNPWSFLMTHRRSAIAAAATLLVATGIAVSVLNSAPRSIAFAQVVDHVQQTKTCQYTETRSTIPRGDEPRGPTTVAKVMILGRSRERKEWISSTAGDPLPEGHMWTQIALGISISDLAAGKLVLLDPKTKTFSETKTILGISPDDGKVHESTVKPVPEVDFYARIREFPADKAERLPEQEVAGKRVIGFRTVETIERAGGAETWTRTYWVDVAANVPVQIETTHETTNPRMGQSRWVLSDIVFDEPLDEALFSTDPPEGYAVRNE